MKNRIAIFGATGSVGTQTLCVSAQGAALGFALGETAKSVSEGNTLFEIVALTALNNSKSLNEQAEKFHAQKHLGELSPDIIRGLIKNADMVVNAVPGFAGLQVSLEVLKAGKILLAANKESIAIAGKFLKQIAGANGAEIRPLDSEASAIWKLINDNGRENISSITLTCSGGPFFGKSIADLQNVSVADALKHPTWKMGPKISVDSATLINKVFEVFEVANLFNIELSKINIVIHRQSVVHSMIHTKSGATKMQISQNDMRLPIHYAMNFPNNEKPPFKIIRNRKSELSFDAPDRKTFVPLEWLRIHGENPVFPILLNAANDFAVARFLAGEIKFLDIFACIESAISKWIYTVPPSNLEELISLHEKITAELKLEYIHSSPMLTPEILKV